LKTDFIRIDRAFPRELADAGRAILWRDTGCDPDDSATWRKPVIRLGYYEQAPFRTAVNTPVLHAAFDRLVGKDDGDRATGRRTGASSLEASPGSFDFLVGYAFCSRPGFDSRLAILRDGLPHDPAGNGMSGDCRQNDCHQRDDADHLPSMTLTPSHTAPTKPETIMVMTALKV
jgi:hypothetical protein